MTAPAEQIRSNVGRVRERMAAAAERAGRNVRDVMLVAVTKYVEAEVAAWLVEAGCVELGESRPQELWKKASQRADSRVRWHLIGHLQRNKIARTLPLVAWIHSVDSLRLLQALEEEARRRDQEISVLLEVNVSREPAKHGFAPEEIAPLLPQLDQLHFVRVRGLMCMAGLAHPGESARGDFRALRQLSEQLRAQYPDRPYFQELSMGMSDDFEVAIEEGATMVRVGSALFAAEGS